MVRVKEMVEPKRMHAEDGRVKEMVERIHTEDGRVKEMVDGRVKEMVEPKRMHAEDGKSKRDGRAKANTCRRW